MPKRVRARTNPHLNSRSGAERPLSNAEWVRQTLRQMALEEKLGQLLMLPFWGDSSPNHSAEFPECLRAVEQLHVGGFMLHTRTTSHGLQLGRALPTAETTNELQVKTNIPLFFAADFERGTAMRLA